MLPSVHTGLRASYAVPDTDRARCTSLFGDIRPRAGYAMPSTNIAHSAASTWQPWTTLSRRSGNSTANSIRPNQTTSPAQC
eukprot:1461258-Rhodomonas_salina.1